MDEKVENEFLRVFSVRNPPFSHEIFSPYKVNTPVYRYAYKNQFFGKGSNNSLGRVFQCYSYSKIVQEILETTTKNKNSENEAAVSPIVLKKQPSCKSVNSRRYYLKQYSTKVDQLAKKRLGGHVNKEVNERIRLWCKNNRLVNKSKNELYMNSIVECEEQQDKNEDSMDSSDGDPCDVQPSGKELEFIDANEGKETVVNEKVDTQVIDVVTSVKKADGIIGSKEVSSTKGPNRKIQKHTINNKQVPKCNDTPIQPKDVTQTTIQPPDREHADLELNKMLDQVAHLKSNPIVQTATIHRIADQSPVRKIPMRQDRMPVMPSETKRKATRDISTSHNQTPVMQSESDQTTSRDITTRHDSLPTMQRESDQRPPHEIPLNHDPLPTIQQESDQRSVHEIPLNHDPLPTMQRESDPRPSRDITTCHDQMPTIQQESDQRSVHEIPVYHDPMPTLQRESGQRPAHEIPIHHDQMPTMQRESDQRPAHEIPVYHDPIPVIQRESDQRPAHEIPMHHDPIPVIQRESDERATSEMLMSHDQLPVMPRAPNQRTTRETFEHHDPLPIIRRTIHSDERLGQRVYKAERDTLEQPLMYSHPASVQRSTNVIRNNECFPTSKRTRVQFRHEDRYYACEANSYQGRNATFEQHSYRYQTTPREEHPHSNRTRIVQRTPYGGQRAEMDQTYYRGQASAIQKPFYTNQMVHVEQPIRRNQNSEFERASYGNRSYIVDQPIYQSQRAAYEDASYSGQERIYGRAPERTKHSILPHDSGRLPSMAMDEFGQCTMIDAYQEDPVQYTRYVRHDEFGMQYGGAEYEQNNAYAAYENPRMESYQPDVYEEPRRRPNRREYPHYDRAERVVYESHQNSTSSMEKQHGSYRDNNWKPIESSHKRQSLELEPELPRDNTHYLKHTDAVYAEHQEQAKQAERSRPVTDPPPVQDKSEPESIQIGQTVRKHFPGFGWFKGKVARKSITVEGMPYYRILYEDGDEEDMPLDTLRQVLVSNPNTSY